MKELESRLWSAYHAIQSAKNHIDTRDAANSRLLEHVTDAMILLSEMAQSPFVKIHPQLSEAMREAAAVSVHFDPAAWFNGLMAAANAQAEVASNDRANVPWTSKDIQDGAIKAGKALEGYARPLVDRIGKTVGEWRDIARQQIQEMTAATHIKDPAKPAATGANPTPQPPSESAIVYRMVKTTRRLTFDILSQREDLIFKGDDDGPYFTFTASNGYQVISRSRMDIQTERLWLLGAKHEDEARSGSMVFSSDVKRDAAYEQFVKAIDEWAEHNGGRAIRLD